MTSIAILEPSAHTISGGAYVRSLESGVEWVIGNNLVERHLRYDPVNGLSTQSWLHTSTGSDFSEPHDAAGQPAPEASFCLDGETYRASATIRFRRDHFGYSRFGRLRSNGAGCNCACD